MATLILTTVGTLVGGPIGGALGALIGQSVDARLFAPPGREGPRLSDLRVQTSSYGSDVPAISGRMRVSGTVIWASDLVEHRQRSGGKGQPGVTNYSYSVSMAVALSSRPLARIGRMWAEGNLLRGEAGDFKSPVTMRLYGGGEDQPVDPLIAAAVGIGQCPAYRGIAYVVLEDMDLAPFGNRIPSLTFDVESADAVPLTLATPIRALLPDAAMGDGGPVITGAALAGGTVRDWLRAFAPLLTVEQGQSGWRIGDAPVDAPVTLGLAAGDGGEGGGGDGGGGAASRSGAARVQRRQGDDAVIPAAVQVDAYEPARDFQLVRTSARVAGGRGADARVTLPLAMPAATARQLAADAARRHTARADNWAVPQGFAALAIGPGSSARWGIGGTALTVEERRISGATVHLSLTRRRSLSPPAMAGEVGSHAPSPDLVAGATVAALFAVPAADGSSGGTLLLAAAGTGAGWRRGQVSLIAGSGGAPEVIADIATVAVLGHAVAATGAATALVIDHSAAIEVVLLRDDMLLAHADDAALLGGANLALLGDELIQFGRADPLGERRWRLTRLLRGRLGTDAAMTEPVVARPFTLARDAALLPVVANFAPVVDGGTVIVESAVADAVILPIASRSAAQRPLSPVHPAVTRHDDGAITLAWTRRSRTGFGWVDALDAPLDQRDESYRVTVGDGASASELTVSAPFCRIEAAMLAPWQADGAVMLAIRQWGEAGQSPPLSLLVPLA